MAYFRLLSGKKDRLDPLDGFVPGPASAPAAPPPAKWEPPEGSYTFAALGRAEAERAAAARRHVVIREDPMFGRRGYVREVIPDAEHGFLILVVAFVVRKRESDPWVEYYNPPPDARRYWRPDKVEFA